MAPIVHGLEAKYHGRIGFVYLDIDDPQNERFRQHFGFRYQPEFYLIDGAGEVVQKWIGYVPAQDFEAAFAALLGP